MSFTISTTCDSCADLDADAHCSYLISSECRKHLCLKCSIHTLDSKIACFECYKNNNFPPTFVSTSSLQNVFGTHIPHDIRSYCLKIRELSEMVQKLDQEVYNLSRQPQKQKKN